MERNTIASPEEVLEFLTNVMRNESGTAAMKAAELLGKRMGLFVEHSDDLPTPVIIDDIGGGQCDAP